MEKDREITELNEAREKAKNFVEYTRWFEIGPLRGWNRKDVLYLLCLGSFPDMKINGTLLGKVFSDKAPSTSERLKKLEDEGVIEQVASDDKRAKYFKLTEKGEKQYQSACLFLYLNATSNPIDINKR